MSTEAMAWALRADLTGPLHPAHRLVLIALADHASSDGTGAWPSKARLAHRLGTTETSIRRAFRELERVGLIVRGNQERAVYLRADRRPVVWDLQLGARVDPATPGDEDTMDQDGDDLEPVVHSPVDNRGGQDVPPPHGGAKVFTTGGPKCPPNQELEPSL